MQRVQYAISAAIAHECIHKLLIILTWPVFAMFWVFE